MCCPKSVNLNAFNYISKFVFLKSGQLPRVHVSLLPVSRLCPHPLQDEPQVLRPGGSVYQRFDHNITIILGSEINGIKVCFIVARLVIRFSSHKEAHRPICTNEDTLQVHCSSDLSAQ